jgi:hypothetical protein
VHNVALRLDGQLAGIVLYQISHDRQYLIGNHMKGRRDLPRITQFLEHAAAGEAHRKGIPFLNVEMDLGIAGLREHKQAMDPVRMIRKYRLTPDR